MIEIKITIDSALNLLLNRMKVELSFRQRCGEITKGLRLENLSFNQLYSIARSAVFDTAFMLPIDLMVQESNLNYIITATIKSLAKVFHRDEFSIFSTKQTEQLLEPIYRYYKEQLKTKNFERN